MARRLKGEGTVRKRQDGRWEGRYTDQYDKKRKSVYGRTQKEVVEKLRTAMYRSNNREYILKNGIPLYEWANIWLDTYCVHMEVHIIPALGDIPIDKLTTEAIQNFYKEKMKSLSKKTVNNIHNSLHRCLEQARGMGYIQSNPASACSVPRYEMPEPISLEDDEITDFFKLVDLDDVYDQVSVVALFTGMRESEILGLRWKDVGWDSHTVYICRQLQKDRIIHSAFDSKYFIGSPKNNKPRTIKVPDFVMDVLRIRKSCNDLEKSEHAQDWEGDNALNKGLVFTLPNGRHLTHNTVAKHYKKLAGKLNTDADHFHCLRYSYATLSITTGENLKIVQENMGHHSIAFMLRKYGGTIAKMREDSAQRMQSYIDDKRKDVVQV